ncbi:MAG: hypothetical protein HXY49_12100 [Ignavibacteriaceae bacterium]|nr:hypothetical protein [Ignavibacteriaceae bacterium]
MIKLLTTSLLALMLLFPQLSFAQEEKDSSKSKDEWEWDWDEWDEFELKMDQFDFNLKGSPTIGVNYGISKITLDNLNSSLTKPGLLELKLGYTTERMYRNSENLIKYKFQYLYLSNFSVKLRKDPGKVCSIESDLWRFGFGRSSGYGYDAGIFSIIPYYNYSFGWSRANIKETPPDSMDQLRLARFDESFRFGTGSEGGLIIRLKPAVAIEASYERAVVFERHLFWKWAGSAILEAIGQWALNEFIDEIASSSPAVTPVINFLLKNALSYGVYELRKEKMNWPFSSAAPLAYDQYKFGVTFTF